MKQYEGDIMTTKAFAQGKLCSVRNFLMDSLKNMPEFQGKEKSLLSVLNDFSILEKWAWELRPLSISSQKTFLDEFFLLLKDVKNPDILDKLLVHFSTIFYLDKEILESVATPGESPFLSYEIPPRTDCRLNSQHTRRQRDFNVVLEFLFMWTDPGLDIHPSKILERCHFDFITTGSLPLLLDEFFHDGSKAVSLPTASFWERIKAEPYLGYLWLLLPYKSGDRYQHYERLRWLINCCIKFSGIL